ncbi:MAG TPA: DUF2066 domain-containing protein [Steroidobacteraceae bacterium]
MRQYFWFPPRFSRHAALLVALCAALFASSLSHALTRTEIYQALAPYTDRSEAGQTAAFQTALKTVLVRVTGARSVDEDGALAPLIANARRYVQQYRQAADGQIWVAFDGPAIERWLTQNGQPLWGRDRPATFVWLAAQNAAQSGTVITADDTSELKAAIDQAASQRGLPLQWPSTLDLQRNHIDYAGVVAGSPATLAEIAKRLGADGVLIGKANGNTAASNVRWIHLFQDRSSEYSGMLEGVNRAADLYASLFAASGSLAAVDVEISGVADLHDYAAIESFLESQTSISHVSIESFSGDTVRVKLAMRGSAESLQRALTVSGHLRPAGAGDNGIQRFQLHH